MPIKFTMRHSSLGCQLATSLRECACCEIFSDPEYDDHNVISLYIFGIQEIVKLNASSVIQADEKNMDSWADSLLTAVNSKRMPSNKVSGCFNSCSLNI